MRNAKKPIKLLVVFREALWQKKLTLEKRIRLETLLKLPFDGLMGNLSMGKKLPKIAKLLEIS